MIGPATGGLFMFCHGGHGPWVDSGPNGCQFVMSGGRPGSGLGDWDNYVPSSGRKRTPYNRFNILILLMSRSRNVLWGTFLMPRATKHKYLNARAHAREISPSVRTCQVRKTKSRKGDPVETENLKH